MHASPGDEQGNRAALQAPEAPAESSDESFNGDAAPAPVKEFRKAAPAPGPPPQERPRSSTKRKSTVQVGGGGRKNASTGQAVDGARELALAALRAKHARAQAPAAARDEDDDGGAAPMLHLWRAGWDRLLADSRELACCAQKLLP